MKKPRTIDQACAATASSERSIESALNLLKADRPCNGYGVYMDRHSIISDLVAAQRDLKAACEALQAYPWPTADDYKET